LARQKERQNLEGHLMPEHVHLFIAIPPRCAVASVIGFLKSVETAPALADFSSFHILPIKKSSWNIS
jgi:REP element-mobilizing transposase RayT